MSYIRSTSNPEGLYIFCNMNDVVEFHKGSDFIGVMPAHVFNVLIDSYIEKSMEDAEFHDARIEEIFEDGEIKMKLSYGHHWEIVMWDTTWYYIARSNYGRSKPFWKTRLRRRLLGFWI